MVDEEGRTGGAQDAVAAPAREARGDPVLIRATADGGWEWLAPGARRKPGMRVCGAKTRGGRGFLASDGVRRCGHAVGRHHSRRCRFHGRDSAGPLKHGLCSKYPGRLGVRIAAAQEDPRLLDMARPIAILDVAVERAVGRVEEADTPAFRAGALELYDGAIAAQRAGEAVEAARLLNELGDLLRRGCSEDRAFRDLVDAAIDLSRRQEAAMRIRMEGAQQVSLRELVALFGRAFGILERELPDMPERAERIERMWEAEVIGYGVQVSRSNRGPLSVGHVVEAAEDVGTTSAVRTLTSEVGGAPQIAAVAGDG